MNFLNDLNDLIKTRKEALPEGSYTTKLFTEGVDRILRKVGEEAGEFIIGVKNGDTEEMTNEAADLIFHMMVALREQNVSFEEVVKVLEKRHQ